MGLTSSSTLQDALDQYNDNLAWDGNITKARLALEAVRFLLVNRPVSNSEATTKLDYADLQKQADALSAYVATVGNTSSRSTFVRGVPLRP